MQNRSVEKEWIDLGSEFYTLEEYRECLKQLARVGKLLGGDRASLKTFKRLNFVPESILDVGCGGGAFTYQLAQLYPNTQIIGIDLSEQAIQYAQQHFNSPHLSFHIPKGTKLAFPPKSIDVITTTLVCHHMLDEEIIQFLKECKEIAKKSVIINDLHRHLLALASFSMIAPVLFHNRLITHDGALSIKKGFKKKEWEYYLNAAGIKKKNYTIEWNWAFRWMVQINFV